MTKIKDQIHCMIDSQFYGSESWINSLTFIILIQFIRMGKQKEKNNS